MAEPGTDQHEGGITVWESAHHAGTAADLSVEALHQVVGADACPVFAGEVVVSQRGVLRV